MAIAIERAHFLAERRKAETLSQRADLASALLASFSHDLRTPVTSVRVAVTNLQDVTLSPEERRAQADLALQELARLTRLFQDILDMARVDAAAVSPDRRWVTPADVVDAAVAYVAQAIAGNELQIDADGQTEIQVDPRLTSTALAHVLENAGRYRRTERRSRCAPGPRAMARISWCGITGLGSTPRTFDHLFEPFYRGPKTRHATGSGLGLAITRGLLAAEGGRIWCENVPDGGAQFTIMVPSPVRALDAQTT